MREFCTYHRGPFVFDRVEGERRVFRLERECGMHEFRLGGNLFLVYEWKGVKEWDGFVLTSWAEVKRVGLKIGPSHPVQWYRTL
jgi:hypothetical protein